MGLLTALTMTRPPAAATNSALAAAPGAPDSRRTSNGFDEVGSVHVYIVLAANCTRRRSPRCSVRCCPALDPFTSNVLEVRWALTITSRFQRITYIGQATPLAQIGRPVDVTVEVPTEIARRVTVVGPSLDSDILVTRSEGGLMRGSDQRWPALNRIEKLAPTCVVTTQGYERESIRTLALGTMLHTSDAGIEVVVVAAEVDREVAIGTNIIVVETTAKSSSGRLRMAPKVPFMVPFSHSNGWW